MTDRWLYFAQFAKAAAEAGSFKAGETIFRAGDRASELYVIAGGRVEIRIDDRVIATLGEHEIFGEMALIDNAPRSATAIATTDVSLVPIDEKQFIHLVQHLPYFALNVMRTLSKRLRNAQSV